MDENAYRNTPFGKPYTVRLGSASYCAYLPSNLPRRLDLDTTTISKLSKADQILGRLDALTSFVPNPYVIVRPYLRREAVASSRIEGTHSTLADVLAAEAAESDLTTENHDLTEVLNYVSSLEYGINTINTIPLSARLLKSMHSVLLKGTRGENKTPGEFRNSQNWIDGTMPADAFFVPPAPDDMLAPMTDLERYLNEDSETPALVSCAMAHYQFETIHPFLDGNGRLGRLFIVLYLLEKKVLNEPMIYLSAFLEQNKTDYVRCLQLVREPGDYNAWLQFFFDAVVAQAQTAIATAKQLLELGETLKAKLRSSGARGQAIDVVDLLIESPYTSAPRLVKRFGLSRAGAKYILDRLQREKIIRSARSPGRSMLFYAPEIMEVLEGA